MNNKNTFLNRIFAFILGACALFEFLIIQYFNIFEAKEHLGIDSSWEYLKLAVLNKEGGIFPTEYLYETTSPGTDKIATLFVLLNKITGNIWVSFGVGSMIITLVTLWVLWKLLDGMKLELIPKLVVVNLFLCPYLANGFEIYNDLGYFSCVNGMPGYENTIVLLMFMAIYILTFDELNVKRWIFIAVTLVLYLFKGLTSGVSVVTFCGAPVIFYVFAKAFLRNDIKELISWKALFLYAMNIVIVIGRAIGSAVGFSYGESRVDWITAPDFFENIQHEFLGYMLLVGAIPKRGASRTPFSAMGLVYVFGLIVFTVILVSVIYMFVRFIKEAMWEENENDVILFGLATIVSISLEFGLLNTNVAQDIFETRYLTTALLCGFIFVGCFVQSLDDELLFKQLGILMLAGSIIAINMFSDYILAIIDNRAWKVDEVQEIIDETDAGLIFFWDKEKELLPTYEVIRVTDFDRVYKSINNNKLLDYGQYKYYDDPTEYVGPTVIVVNNDDIAPDKSLMEHYEQIGSVDNMGIYYCKDNPVDGSEFVIGNN